MDINHIERIYFTGIGGIGMSALARFFNERGALVSGYDRTESALTRQLAAEGMDITYNDDITLLDKDAQLVVYTPAIPSDNKILSWYRANNYPVYKRSDVLQWITEKMFAITIAGTHGKTTVSTLIAHILRTSGYGCNAFLGGISVNYDKNYWGNERNVAVIEADEYDRSFLKLSPDIAVLTAMDADHLDIYGTVTAMEDAFIQYTSNIKPDGTLWYKQGLHKAKEFKAAHQCTYSLQSNGADVYGSNIRMNNGGYIYDVYAQDWMLNDIKLHIGGMHNVENSIIAIAIARQLQIDDALILEAIASFKGVKRRFEYIVKNEHIVYIDDYAHHPEELAALIKSAKTLFPAKKCIIAFQPHLYSRTRDLADAFAASLDMADEVLLLDIYPAREQPVEGVTVQMIADRMGNPHHTILSKEGVVKFAENLNGGLFITAGAGDIDQLVQPVANAFLNKENK